jgi:ribosomal protein S27E
MSNQGYVQTRCPHCGAGAWALSTCAVPCQTCGQSIAAIGGGAPVMSAPASVAPPAHLAFGTGAPIAAGGYQHAGYGAPAASPAYGGYQPPAVGGYQAPAAAAPPAAVKSGPAANFAVNVGGFKIPFKVGGGGGGLSKFKIIGSVILVIAVSIAGVIFKMKFGSTAKGNLSYASLGVDRKHPDADELISALASPAKKWKRDAIWWSANFQAVNADGKIDISKGAEVVYISENGVQSSAKSVRKDSIKKYSAGGAGVSHRKMWGATKPWDGIEKHPTPTCAIKDVMALVGKTLPAGKTVRITFDPTFADYYAWHVISSDPKIDTQYAFSDCSVIQ